MSDPKTAVAIDKQILHIPETRLPGEFWLRCLYIHPDHFPEELLGLVSRDLRQPVDVRDVIARVVDGSWFEEFKPRYGPTMVCGWATIHGHQVGILGNNGVIYRKEI